MFNLQGSEIIIVLLLALVVLGPEKLPDAMRKLGQFYAELKKMSSGFQEEFRAAVEEPMRELRDTANTLRDSADFTKLQEGERSEKPKSAEMSAVGDPSPEPVADIPTFESPGDGADSAPTVAEDSRPAPFSGVSSAAPRTGPAAMPTPPPPFASMTTEEAGESVDSAEPGAADEGGPVSNGPAHDAPADVPTDDSPTDVRVDGLDDRHELPGDAAAAELEPAPSDDPATR